MHAESHQVKSIDKALTVLQYLSSNADGVRMTTVSAHLGISIPTTHRILSTMIKRGFVDQDPETKKYRLGINAQLLGTFTMTRANLYRFGLPCLQKLNEETQETTNLVIRNVWEAVYVLQVESKNSLRVANRVGSSVGLYCTAAGKTLLAYMDNNMRDKYFEQTELNVLTPNTLRTKEELEREIRAIKKNGIAYDREEQALGEACIASPVFMQSGGIAAAISISSPATRLKRKKVEEFSVPLRNAAKELSLKFGFRGFGEGEQ